VHPIRSAEGRLLMPLDSWMTGVRNTVAGCRKRAVMLQERRSEISSEM
jgi:hypothetical protein